MSDQKTMNNVLLVATVVGVFAFVGLILFFVFRFGPANVFVVAPKGVSMTVAVDGKATESVRGGGFRVVKVGQGDHTLTLSPSEGTPADVKINVPDGFSNFLVGLPGTCYAELDVTESHYGRAKGRPEVLATHQGGTATLLTSVPAIGEKALPEHVSENTRQTLVLEVPCESTGTPSEVLRAVGM